MPNYARNRTVQQAKRKYFRHGGIRCREEENTAQVSADHKYTAENLESLTAE